MNSISSITNAMPDRSGFDAMDSVPVLDLRRIAGAIWFHRWLIAGVTAGCIMLGLVATMLLTPRYTASASVQIDQEEQQILESQTELSGAAWQDAERFLKTHVDVLRSRRMAKRVAGELKLFDNADDFFAKMQVSPSPAAAGKAARDELVLRTIAENLDIHLPATSRIVTVSFTSPDAEFSARFANAFVASYLRYNVDRRLDSTAYARDFLSRQLGEARDRLEAAERDANDYARSVGLVRTSPGAAGVPDLSITAVDLGNDNNALADARNQRIAAQSKWSLVAGAPDMAIGDAISNQAMQQLIASRAEVDAELQAQLADKKPTHPAVAPLRNRLAEYDAQIAKLAQGIRRSVRDAYLMAGRREAELQSRVNSLKNQTQRERDDAVQLNTLMREVDTSRQLYDGLLQRYREMSAEANITSNNVQQIDHAIAPIRPSSPRPLLNLALAALFGLLLSAGIVFLREQADDRLKTPGEIEERLGLKLLGITPRLREGLDPVEVVSEPGQPLAEAFTSLRTALFFATPAGLPRKLLLSSTEAGEGKSSTAYGIARSIAESGRKVLLIDCDLRRPSIHAMLGIRQSPGLSEVLTGQLACTAAVTPTDIPQLSVLTSGARPNVPTDLLSSAQFAELLVRLEASYDTILLDGPPVLGLADAAILASQPGVATLFVVEAGRSHRGVVRNAVKRLSDNGAGMIGAVMARFDFAQARRQGIGHEYGNGYAYYEYGA
ncbi:GumC family protein [Croceicoccus bisphenolivorans]|uniref:GumC family protein n=1 Tax=Croceicoccus bisphenolivorans TaxID=1783232 RepID=UPI00083207D6|nr:polysaccharide biosynthesis tyrosine autokinase [Croceicoccus bisphenolivorans]